ncbi:MAG: hypothetical protein ABIG92_03195 [Candidatus Omnitrophota bacterium]
MEAKMGEQEMIKQLSRNDKNKKFLVSYLIFFLLFYGCSEKPISEKQRAIDVYKEKQNRQYVRDSEESLICVASDTTPEIFHRTLKVSPDGKKIAYLGQNSKQNYFFLKANNQRHRSYYDIGPDSILFSPDSRHIAYIAIEKNNSVKKHLIVKDNVEISERYDDTLENGIIFSPDSQKLAYAAKKNGVWYVKICGSEIEYLAYDGVLGKTLMLTPDSQHLIYGTGIEAENKYFIVIDGILQKAYSGMGDVIVASKHIAYLVGDKKDNKAQMVVLDGAEHKRYDSILELELVFSQNGKHLAYAAQKDDKQFLVIDGVEQKEYDKMGPFLFSPDEKRLAYVAIQGEDTFVVLDGEELKHYPAKLFVDEDGRLRSSLLDKTFVFSPDSQHFAYGVNTKLSHFMVLDGLEQKRYKQVSQYIAFSPDSKHFGYLAVGYDDKLLAVVDGIEYPIDEGGAAKLCFSPDSKHFAYIVSDEGRWSVIIDGEAGKYYPNLLVDERKTLFNEDGSFHYLVMCDSKVFLVEEKIVPTSQR